MALALVLHSKLGNADDVNECGGNMYCMKEDMPTHFNLLKPTGHVMHQQFNPLKTKCRLLYLKIRFVQRSKHFSSRL